MVLIRRIVLAACVAVSVSVVLWVEAGLTLPVHGVELSALFSRPGSRNVVRLQAHIVSQSGSRESSHRIRRHARPPKPLSAATTVLAYAAPPIQAKAAILIDMRTRTVLFSDHPDLRLPIASTTKITTAALALGYSRPSDLVTVSNRAATVGESTMALRRGERVTVLQLLYGLLLNSGNDAAVALAEHAAGNEERFVAMMNALARALHMHDTHYANVHGLDAPNHYSSGGDLAKIALYAMRDPTFRRVVASTSYHIWPTKHNREHFLASVNRVIYWYPGIDGVKPGDTDAAGLCQVVSVNRDGRRLLAVLLHTPTLYIDIRNLLNFGLRDFRWVPSLAWGDGPDNSLSGGAGADRWIYYFGAGHYIRGLFLSYFNTHGGLHVFGYPRTEQIVENDQLVQYFQGGELIYDPTHRNVYPADLGVSEGGIAGIRSVISVQRMKAAGPFSRLYKQLGGRGVMGDAISGLTTENRYPVQFFQYGELAFQNKVAGVVPLGDAVLRRKGWLPANGAADSFPSTMAPDVVAAIRPPRRVAKRPRIPVLVALNARHDKDFLQY